MKAFTSIAIILAVASCAGSAQSLPWQRPGWIPLAHGLRPVANDDPLRIVLGAWQGAVEADYERYMVAMPVFSDWFEIKSDDARVLAPHHRFAVTFWHQLEHPQAGRCQMALAGGLQTTLAVDLTTGSVTEFYGSGEHEEFGRFLAERSVRILEEADARRVWGAFCDLHRRGWSGQPVIQVDEFTWRFGVNEISGRRYYYEAKLNSDHQVISFRLRSVEI